MLPHLQGIFLEENYEELLKICRFLLKVCYNVPVGRQEGERRYG